jgi:hypothetical protein
MPSGTRPRHRLDVIYPNERAEGSDTIVCLRRRFSASAQSEQLCHAACASAVPVLLDRRIHPFHYIGLGIDPSKSGVPESIKQNSGSQLRTLSRYSFRIVRPTRSGRISELKVRLSDWEYNIIQSPMASRSAEITSGYESRSTAAFTRLPASTVESRMNGRFALRSCTKKTGREATDAN